MYNYTVIINKSKIKVDFNKAKVQYFGHGQEDISNEPELLGEKNGKIRKLFYPFHDKLFYL